MEDNKENEYQKLPTDEKCVHKIWKARLQGYEEAIKLFNKIDDEKSLEWNKYLGLIKKFVSDSNAVAQERGMEAALVFVENCASAGKTTGEVMSGVVQKCIAAPKTKTKDLALQITLMYIEIEKAEAVQEELLKGMDHKNPKIVSACIHASTQALQQFGNKVFAIKPLVKKIPALLADRDKTVRDEGKAMVVEMHRWIGAAIEPHIASLQPVQQQELRDAFSNSGTAKPTRYLKSQQQKMETVRDGHCDGGGADDDDVDEPEEQDLDPYDLMAPIDILSKLPKDFYEKIEAKKWQERKEVLDAVENLLKNNPRLENGDYADLVRALKKVISKDTNVMLVALAGRLMASIAAGLRNKFAPYAVACTSAILEKFKEKKTNVVTALRDAIDAIYPCTNLEAISEDVLEAFNNKNPSVKAETALYLARNWCKTQPAALNKKMLKVYVGGLLKLLESADPTVRDAAAEALGCAAKLVGEKAVAPFIGTIDNLKQQKIKEFTDKAVILVKAPGGARKKEPKAAESATSQPSKAGSTAPKPVKRPNTANKAKRPASGIKKSASSSKANVRSQPVREQELSPEEVDEMGEHIFGKQIMNGLSDANWKNRVTAITSFANTQEGLTPATVGSQLLLRILHKKPGLKDTNVQVAKSKLELVKSIAEGFPMTMTSTECILEDVVEKLGDVKCCNAAGEALTALAEASSFEPVVLMGLEYAMDKQKNPKVQAELFIWLSTSIREFGMCVNEKALMTHVKKAVTATNPVVRTAAVTFLGVLSLYLGPSVITHFDSEKPVLKQQITLELDKYANDSPPPAVRGVSKSASKASILDGEDDSPTTMDQENESCYEAETTQIGSTEATDISSLITETLINELNDKNWKVRNEALEKVKNIIETSAPIKPSMGELPTALAARLVDSNSKLAQTALSICQELGPAMGVKCKQHAKTFLPNLLQAMGDSKAANRAGALQCVEAWVAAAGTPAIVLQDEILLDALKRTSPAGRQEIFGWLSEALPIISPKSIPKEELTSLIPILYSSVEDRNADVRKKASECVLGFMLHLGYDSMHRQLEKLKPASKAVVLAALDKARPNLPVQPLPASAQKQGVKTVKAGSAVKKEGDKKPTGKVKAIVKPMSARSKKDEEESGVLLPHNNLKNQRIIDDQKLKVLKWNFTVPREEFFELLKDQMTTAGMSRSLITNMFHADFRYHLKALELLTEDLAENGEALTCNVDLILKWITLRFFDTNPSVILKCLEYLSSVFNYLISIDYTMAEYEAGCFIPYLVLKVGDPKDSVRNGVKALFKQICVVYSVTKLFGYLMEGLKSKNARQRAECLDTICHLMECYGSSIMAPSPAIACKELARHIADRDNAVRNAALNAVTCAYFLEGERIYKMIGNISDKDLSLLEERIKRAAKTRGAESRKMLIPLTASGKQLVRQPSDSNLMEDHSPSVERDPPEEEEEIEQVETAPPIVPRRQEKPQVECVEGPFRLDPELVAKLDAMKPAHEAPKVLVIDTSILDEPIPRPAKIPSYGYTHDSSPLMKGRTMASPKMPPTNDETIISDTIHSIGSPNFKMAVQAISQLHTIINADGGASLGPEAEERLVRAIAAQMRLLRARSSSDETLSGYRYILSLISCFLEHNLGSSPHVSSAAVGVLLPELLKITSIQDTALPSDMSKIVRVCNQHSVNILYMSDKTTLLCKLTSLLQEAVAGNELDEFPNYRDLLLKCFWKVLKIIPQWDLAAVDLDQIFLKIHQFYKAYPNSFWKQNSIPDTPYKTIKTLVHTLTKLKGRAILQHLQQIPENSEIRLYINKVIAVTQGKKEELKENINVTENKPTENRPKVVNPITNAVSEEIAYILKKISDRDHTPEALMQLYQLKERNPTIDIWSHMQGSSSFLRNFVESSLKEIAEKKKYNAPAIPVNITIPTDVTNDNQYEDPEDMLNFYTEKLRILQARAGLSESNVRSPIADKTMDTINDNTRPNNYDPHLEWHQNQPRQQRQEDSMDQIRQKLNQLKTKT